MISSCLFLVALLALCQSSYSFSPAAPCRYQTCDRSLAPTSTRLNVVGADGTTLEPLGILMSLGIAVSTAVYLNSPTTSDGIRDAWDSTVVKGANKATIAAEDVAAKKSLDLPSLKDTASPEQVTALLSEVANTVEQQNRNAQKKSLVERILPKKVSRVFINRDNLPPGKPFNVAPLATKKTPFVLKLAKKIVMPWKKWRNL